MQKLSRFAVIVLLVTILLSMTGSVFAQETYCFDLSAEDCDLYTQLSESGAMPSSAGFEVNVDGRVVGLIPVAAGEQPTPVEFNALITGAYVFSEDEVDAAVATFGELSVLEVNLGDMIDLFRSVLSAFDAQMNIQLTLPPDMGGSAFGPFDLWLVDGVGYIDVTPIGMVMGSPDMAGVMGMDLIDIVQVPLSQVTLADIGAVLDGLGDFGPSDFGTMGESPMDNQAFQNFFSAFTNPPTEADLAGAMSLERLPNETLNGTEVVVFQTTMDFASLFELDFVRNQMRMQMQMQGMPDDMDVDSFVDALTESFAGSTMTITEKFDPQTGYGLASTMVMDMTMTLEPIMAMTGEEATGMEGPIAFRLSWEALLTDIDSVQSIDVPADAQVIPVQSLFGG